MKNSSVPGSTESRSCFWGMKMKSAFFFVVFLGLGTASAMDVGLAANRRICGLRGANTAEKIATLAKRVPLPEDLPLARSVLLEEGQMMCWGDAALVLAFAGSVDGPSIIVKQLRQVPSEYQGHVFFDEMVVSLGLALRQSPERQATLTLLNSMLSPSWWGPVSDPSSLAATRAVGFARLSIIALCFSGTKEATSLLELLHKDETRLQPLGADAKQFVERALSRNRFRMDNPVGTLIPEDL